MNHSIQKLIVRQFIPMKNRGVSVLRSSLKGVFLIFASLSSCCFFSRKENTPLVRLYANRRSNNSVYFSRCEVSVI